MDNEIMEMGKNFMQETMKNVNSNRGIIRMCEQVAAFGNTLILYSA